MKGTSVLITGGTGSLGCALIKQILRTTNWNIVVYSRDEGKQALKIKPIKSKRIYCVIGDVRDYAKLEQTVKLHKPQYIIHAAALKRIDDMEFHPDECVKTNIIGSENVARAALVGSVKKCILISTDKACQPVNVYGSSKFIAERIFTNMDFNSDSTIFSSVRYGNVIASRGSFIPLWLEQIKNGEKITITSMDCSRFLFTLGNAVKTVLDSMSLAEGGEVFVPKINSFSMETVLKAVKKISKEERDTLVNIIGMRPGEKIHEDMLSKTELDFTYEVTNKLLVILPQYTTKHHSFDNKYSGAEFNSSLHLNDNVDDLIKLIDKGLK